MSTTTTKEQDNSVKLLRPKDVMKKLGVSRTKVFYLSKRETFPKKVVLGPTSVAWVESEIDEWIATEQCKIKVKIKTDPFKELEKYMVTEEHTRKIDHEKFLYPNLIIENHIVTIMGKPAIGKTTLCLYHVAPKLVEAGQEVWYLIADKIDPTRMIEFAEKHRIKLLNPYARVGQGPKDAIHLLEKIAMSGEDITGTTLFFDSIRGFHNMADKQSIKKFFRTMRKLTFLGATIVLLGHTRKGNTIFEDMCDICSDSDELIYLSSTQLPDGSRDVTTVIDQAEGAKVRGIFKPITFNITADRKVTVNNNITTEGSK